MRGYCIAVLAFCTMALSITLFSFSSGLLSTLSPETSLSSGKFSSYNSLDKYIDREEVKLCSRYFKSPESIPQMSKEEWNKKWQTYRTTLIEEEKHDGLSTIYSSIISFVIFTFIFIGHFILYRRQEVNE